MKNLLSLTALFAFGGLVTAQEAPKAAQCPSDQCAKACCGTSLKLSVTGLENEGNTAKAEAALTALDGVEMCQNCSKSGTFNIKYDPAKVKVAAIEKAVTDSGLKIAGHKASFKIKGMMCQSCSNHITALLGKTPGIVSVDEVTHLTGEAGVTFDPKKTDEAKIKAVINKTNYKVIESKPAPAVAPQS
ncbi:heavy-metal-associated domain-containing protein [Verrucomicrobiaceae bacterium 227]